MPISAILFDLDGTLVSTIDAYADAVMQTFGKFGMPMTREQFTKYYKQPLHLEGMLEAYGKTEADLPEIREARDTRYIELLRAETVWLPDAQDVLEALHQRHTMMGLVTGSHMSYVDAIEDRFRLKHYFQAIVTADEMGKFMKPHPHGLLLAADLLNVDPKECLYVGDQGFDMTAARAAGMTSCLVPSAYTPEHAKDDADIVLEKLADVLDLF